MPESPMGHQLALHNGWRACIILTTAIAATLLSARPLSAQLQQTGTMSGVVRSEEGAPIPQALIVLTGSGRRTTTDTAGRFRLASLSPGRHALHVSRIGFAPARLEVQVTPGSVDAELQITLTPTPLSLPSVQVTGTATGRDPLAVAFATTHLAGDALQRELGATIAHTLKAQPGIAMRSMGPGAVMPMMRGLTGDRILVLQDGQRTSDLAGSADDHGVSIDPLSVERLEVIRGPATLLYGNNALGGVVNVITRDIPSLVPESADWIVAAQSETAYPGASASLASTLPVGDRWAVSLRAGARATEDMRIPHDEVLGSRLANTHTRNASGSAGAAYIGEAATAGASVQAYDFSYGLPVPPGAPPVSLAGRRYQGRGQVELTLPGTFLTAVHLDATAQDYSHDELDDDAGQVLQTFDLRTWTGNLTLRQGSRGRLVDGSWGVSGLFKDYSASGVAALTPPAVSRGLGVFAFQAISLGRPTIELGARADDYRISSSTTSKFGVRHDRSFRALSGSIGLRIPVRDGASVAASMTRSFRAPTVEELFSGAAHAGTGAVELGNPALRAERGLSADVVLRVQDARANGQLAVFRQEIRDYVHLADRGDSVVSGVRLPVLEYVQGTAVLQGVEGSLEWAATRTVVVGFMGDYLHARQADGTPLSFMPPSRLGMLVRRDDGRLSLGGDLHYEFRQARVGAAEELPTPAHAIVRLHAGITFDLAGRRHSLTLRAENLTDVLHRESTSRIKDFAPGPGRNIAIAYRVGG